MTYSLEKRFVAATFGCFRVIPFQREYKNVVHVGMYESSLHF